MLFHCSSVYPAYYVNCFVGIYAFPFTQLYEWSFKRVKLVFLDISHEDIELHTTVRVTDGIRLIEYHILHIGGEEITVGFTDIMMFIILEVVKIYVTALVYCEISSVLGYIIDCNVIEIGVVIH